MLFLNSWVKEYSVTYQTTGIISRNTKLWNDIWQILVKMQFSIDFRHVCSKDIQDHVTVVELYHPSYTRTNLTQGIRICSQKWSQVNILIGYRYVSQVIILKKVKSLKLEICQSNCRFKILAILSGTYSKLKSNIRIGVKLLVDLKLTLFWSIFWLCSNQNFKKRKFFCKDFRSAIRLTNFEFYRFDFK